MTDFLFSDSETRSPIDVTKHGAYRLAEHPASDCTVWSFAFDDEPFGTVWSPSWAWGQTEGITADPEPTRYLDFIEDGGYFIAWNANFDRLMWNKIMVPKYGWPELRLEQVLCAQALAEGNNLPGQLEKAAECLRTGYKKDPAGKRLISLLAHGTRDDWSPRENETPQRMGHFRSYCLKDTLAMRDVWGECRPFTIGEWNEYHASERINDRGVAVDDEFAAQAARFAAAETRDLNREIVEVTGVEMTVTNHVKKALWLYEMLAPDEALQLAAWRPPKKKGGKDRYSCDSATRAIVLEAINQPEHAELFEDGNRERIIRFLEIVEAGNATAVHKFAAIRDRATAGRVHGLYSFDGAGQTGRFSSRGVQAHNLIRDPVDKANSDRALDAIDDIMAGRDADELVREFGFPISRLLARLIRPTFIAPNGRVLVWGDYEQIEGRGLPWLAASPAAEKKLELFRSGVDVYRETAGDIAGKPADEVTDFERQALGKVPELSLGFGGGVGALMTMGRNYGVVLPRDEAQAIVYRWRAANPWAEVYWSQLTRAIAGAYGDPGAAYTAGRVRYVFVPNLMRGTLVAILPCGRWLLYPQFKREWAEWEDRHGVKRQGYRMSCVRGFSGGYGRVGLWHGVFAENNTQASAASVLRVAIVRAEERDLEPVLHTHDELATECDTADIQRQTAALQAAMLDPIEWAAGLPLAVEIEHGPYYTK